MGCAGRISLLLAHPVVLYNHIIMGIPITLLNDFHQIPHDRPVVLLMRHSARFPITDPERGFEVPLTPEGVRMAEELGAVLGKGFSCGRLLASPVGRCMATADAIARGARWERQALAEERISHPFIEPAWDLLCAGKVNGILPRPVREALEMLLDHPQPQSMLEVMVTHDTVVGAVVGCLLHAPVHGEHWPEFLEGVFLWREGEQLAALWRGELRLLNVLAA